MLEKFITLAIHWGKMSGNWISRITYYACLCNWIMICDMKSFINLFDWNWWIAGSNLKLLDGRSFDSWFLCSMQSRQMKGKSERQTVKRDILITFTSTWFTFEEFRADEQERLLTQRQWYVLDSTPSQRIYSAVFAMNSWNCNHSRTKGLTPERPRGSHKNRNSF